MSLNVEELMLAILNLLLDFVLLLLQVLQGLLDCLGRDSGVWFIVLVGGMHENYIALFHIIYLRCVLY